LIFVLVRGARKHFFVTAWKEGNMYSAVSLVQESSSFINFLEDWSTALPELALAELLAQPERAAIISVDVIHGFCDSGPLASERVGQIVEPIANLFQAAWTAGLRNIVLVQEAHDPQALEFEAWPPHCVRGTEEAQTVEAFQRLPFFSQFSVLSKNSISSFFGTGLSDWLAVHPQVDCFIAVGDCTDLCTYQLAMHLRLEANARQRPRRVIVPADCTDTYDRTVAAAQKEGGLPHPAELMHQVFLYHMALNGVEVVKHVG
jgi:nicotinamidase-related amidase